MPNKILLVEGSRTQALRFQLEMLRYGLTVEIAGSGEAGLDAARRHPPDVIVLDAELPEVSGFSICRALKMHPTTAHIPVVLLTHRDSAGQADGLDMGAVDCIPKDPFAEHNLIELLRYLGVV
ncbi:MAG: hypothetical protein RLZZ387_2383 [Chloroflexota bacterium]|jgi:DNA-binding response OmpR family regulator